MFGLCPPLFVLSSLCPSPLHRSHLNISIQGLNRHWRCNYKSNRIESNRIESNRIESNRIESNRIEIKLISSQIPIESKSDRVNVKSDRIAPITSLEVQFHFHISNHNYVTGGAIKSNQIITSLEVQSNRIESNRIESNRNRIEI